MMEGFREAQKIAEKELNVCMFPRLLDLIGQLTIRNR
jgi:hypothetical protein